MEVPSQVGDASHAHHLDLPGRQIQAAATSQSLDSHLVTGTLDQDHARGVMLHVSRMAFLSCAPLSASASFRVRLWAWTGVVECYGY